MKATASSPGGARVAGNAQAIIVILIQLLPVLAIISLAPGLPGMLRTFSRVPNFALLVFVALTVPGLCIALFATGMGALVDRVGRRPMLLAAMLTYAVLGVMPVILNNLFAIIASRIGLGIAEAAIMASSTTLLGDYFEGPIRARWIAIQSASISVAATLLFFAGGALASIDWRAPFLLYGATAPLLLWAVIGLWEPPRAAVAKPAADGAAVSTQIDRTGFALVLFVTLLGAIVFYVAPIQISIILGRRGVVDPVRVGMLGALGTLGVPIGALFFKRYAHWPIAAQLSLAFATLGAGLIAMGACSAPVAIIFAMLVNQFGCGLLLCALLSWMMSGLPPDRRGRGTGRWSSSFFLGQFLSPVAVSLIGGSFRGVAAACVVLGLVSVSIGVWAKLSLGASDRSRLTARPSRAASRPTRPGTTP